MNINSNPNGLLNKFFNHQGRVFLKMDRLIDNIKDLPEFKKLFKDIENKFWNSHKQIKASLEEKELL
jgi:hypothetical protein